jgi:PAS domain S-box-containing protein
MNPETKKKLTAQEKNQRFTVKGKRQLAARSAAESIYGMFQARFRLFLEASSSACLILDKDLNYIYFNGPAREFTGIPLEEIKGMNIAEVIPGFEFTPRYSLYREVLATGRPHFEEDHSPGGIFGDRHFRTRIFKMGEELGMIWTDITKRCRAESELMKANAELNSLATHILQVREDERKCVAREIHDELGQSLTAIEMELHWMARKNADADPELRDRIAGLLERSAEAVKTVQRISSELRPGVLDHLGLAAAIEWLSMDFTTRSALKITADIAVPKSRIGEKASTVLFRITQEAMTNVVRHARASRVDISLREAGDAIELVVADDGVGITEDQTRGPNSFGIQGMRERAHEFGGNVSIAGKEGGGTVLAVRLPFAGKASLP